MEQENFKYIILPEYITKDKNLTDKEKNIYSMILTFKQIRTSPINTDVKDIIKSNNINYNNWHYDSQRDYSNYDFTKLYANNF